MKKFLWMLIILFTVSACGERAGDSESTPILLSTPSITIRELPSSTPNPTSIAIPTPTTELPTVLFEDNFEGSLNSGWEWQNEQIDLWNLTNVPSFLQIDVVGGYVNLGNFSNLLLRPAPQGNFKIETYLEFRPRRNNQFAGIILYSSNDNYIQAGRAYCAPVYGCIGKGMYLDIYQAGELQLPRKAARFDNDGVYLRLTRNGTTVDLSVSENNNIWYRVSSFMTDMDIQKIGIVTGQSLENEPVPAIFDYFIVSAID
ncbi:MAG: hypothetical protein ACKOBL_19310 [Chloroflexota bacterium]|jgi:beta-xylosidase